ncbi:MAG: hypothetical protein P8104_13545, partial [Gammaproteobacteria bacterium]
MRYTRDKAQQITNIFTQGGDDQRPLAQHIEYVPFGPFRALSYGNGLQTFRDRDLDYRLQTVQVTGNGAETLNLSYGYDALNNIEHILMPLSNRSQHFSYDTRDRLTQASGPFGQREFTYDANGNRETRRAFLNDNLEFEELLSYDPLSNRLDSLIK